MAGIDLGGAHGKKAVNHEVPLVPFIDFLLCCVMFLLVTAVWNQLARVETHQSQCPGCGQPDPSQEPPQPRTLIVSEAAYRLVRGGEVVAEVPRTGGEDDAARLAPTLASLHSVDPGRDDLEVTATDDVPYRTLIAVLDVAIGQGFDGVSLSPLDRSARTEP